MQNTIVIPGGITTALVLFVLACLVYPAVIKNRTQFYAGFVAVLLMVLLYSLEVMIRQPGFQVFSGAVTGLLQLFALLMFFMSAGGMSVGELAGDLKRAYEVIRRGEEEKTVIIPLSSQNVRTSTGGGPPPATGQTNMPQVPEPPKPQEPPGSIPLEPEEPPLDDED